MTATKGTIADANGTTKADNGDSGYAYTYQWVHAGGGTKTNISGATSSTYTPVDDDEGKKIRVRVSFQDDADHSESRISAATAMVTGNDNDNEPATGRPSISGTAQVARTLTATKGTIADANGTTKADNGDSGYAYTYQWIRVDGGTKTNISGATSSTYTPVDDDEGKKIRVRVSFQDDADHSESRTSAATAMVTGNDNDNEPAISIADASANENDGHLMFEVTLSRSLRNPVKVDFETISGGTATEGVDYWPHDYTHLILAGETTVQMGFALIEDTVDDAGETVKVRLSNARVINAYAEKIADLDITRAEATGTITESSSSSGMDSSDDGDGDDALLARVGDVTPEAATAALFGGDALTGDQLAAMDQLGNRNGAYDLGDLLSWRARCHRNEVRCGGPASATGAGSLPASPAMPPTKRKGRTPSRRRGGARAGRRSGRNMGGSVECVPQRRAMRSGVGHGPGRHGPAVRRATGWIRALALGLVVSAWGCGIGDNPVQPVQPDPGPLHVRLMVPPEARDIGAMLVVEGPGIDSLSAPGFELIQADEASPNRREAIIAGSLSTGPVLQVWVPDRRQLGDYRVTLMQVAGDDYGIKDLTQYGIVISR